MCASVLIKFLVILLFCSIISISDIRTLRIPDIFLVPFLAVLVIFDIVFAQENIIRHIIISLVFLFIFLAIYKFAGGLGFGDVKFAAVLSYSLGLKNGTFAFIFASLSAIIFLLLKKRLSNQALKKEKIPFAPFLSFGTLVVLAAQGAK